MCLKDILNPGRRARPLFFFGLQCLWGRWTGSSASRKKKPSMPSLPSSRPLGPTWCWSGWTRIRWGCFFCFLFELLLGGCARPKVESKGQGKVVEACCGLHLVEAGPQTHKHETQVGKLYDFLRKLTVIFWRDPQYELETFYSKKFPTSKLPALVTSSVVADMIRFIYQIDMINWSGLNSKQQTLFWTLKCDIYQGTV